MLPTILLLLSSLGGDPVEPPEAAASRIDPPKIVRLTAHPSRIELFHAADHKRLVVVAEHADGTTREITKEVILSFGDRPPVQIDRDFVLHAVHDGSGSVRVRFAEHTIEIPVTVENASNRPLVSFQNDVIPVLTRSGCNAGTCHGNSAGKNGFRLSLFGYDVASDHVALTREMRGRRLNTADPDASLMLTKPLRKVPHKGGQRIHEDGMRHATLREWITQGATNDAGKATPLTGIEVLPKQVVLRGAGATQRFLVLATYADKSSRDVTELALLSSNNEPVAKISDSGEVTSAERGEAFVLARFGGIAEVAQVLVVPDDDTFTFPDVPAANYIDEAIYDKQRRMRIAPVAVCDDATFMRRAYLDIINLLPTPAEARTFLDSKDKDKRKKLVDALLRRPEFPDVQAMQWAEVLRIESARLERKGMHVYTEYLRDAFRDDVPMDKLVSGLLIAKGSNFRDAPANFYLTQNQPNLMAEDIAQNFLGIRIQCAQCHNHPFERWTMDDYYGFSAFFSRVRRKRGEHPYEFVIFPVNYGEMRNQRTGQNSTPKFLGGAEPKIEREQDRREVVAQWLTSKDNPWFKTSLANRVWARLFGRGIVEPADDVRVSNPPSHPGLYRTLGDKLAGYGFDVRQLIRDICASRTYQLASADGKSPPGTYAEAPTRRLTAEQLLDAISQVTGVAERYRNLPSGARATQVEDGNPRNRFLDVFGRPRRTSSCTCDRRGEPTLGQALHLINGQTIAQRIRSNTGRLHQLIRAKAAPAAILEELFLAAYTRRPTAVEIQRLLADLPAASSDGKAKAKVKPKTSDLDTTRALEDIFWAMLNSKEFLFNH